VIPKKIAELEGKGWRGGFVALTIWKKAVNLRPRTGGLEGLTGYGMSLLGKRFEVWGVKTGKECSSSGPPAKGENLGPTVQAGKQNFLDALGGREIRGGQTREGRKTINRA